MSLKTSKYSNKLFYDYFNLVIVYFYISKPFIFCFGIVNVLNVENICYYYYYYSRINCCELIYCCCRESLFWIYCYLLVLLFVVDVNFCYIYLFSASIFYKTFCMSLRIYNIYTFLTYFFWVFVTFSTNIGSDWTCLKVSA